ncbi:MAG TPA: radical SAM family heme chaperone HemW [Deltaproteobacteria bacterium]|nr:radical SAM family heme chaperone HemW [Deltaproteobacteria bacterium]HPR54197.1 radical SAM family heme chaperone HemW [Deltaproteobacteria bacterium]HXK45892.1 radical SAM family heme chaperone HemW [Deltaproteobacteria bacterium]
MTARETTTAGLYLHIPFCKTRCAYCDFFSVTDTDLIDAFVRALLREMVAYSEEFREFDTVYIGGGTPSLLSLRQVEMILERVHRVFSILPGAEVTMEINPADWGREHLSMARELGINRISIGVQSFDDRELSLLGRRHSRKQAVRTLKDAAAAGFDNLSLDLMYGLPGQSCHQWEASLVQALDFGPTHLSCYELEIKGLTPLGRRIERGELPLRTEDDQRAFFMRTSEFLEDSGFVHYEISNFAKGMDRASRHNQKYWDHTPYLGIGPSAHSFREVRRWWNHASVTAYVRDLDAGKRPVSGMEELSTEQLVLEALFLGLRTKGGIDLGRFRCRYGCNLMEEKGPELEELCRAGLIEIEGEIIRPTRSGMAVADSLALL